jgi:hypothetical protein
LPGVTYMSQHDLYGIRRVLCTLIVLVSALVSHAGASATLLLEEPYGKLGFFSPTGHVAVYLSGVCADSPLVLRGCAQGETGIVLSRYDGINGYDWAAIPLIPYLYAVERTEDIPLFADAKMVTFLRDRYRRQHLRGIAPDKADGGIPVGNWYELVGSSYDRASYGFEIETSPEQDAALIRAYNSSPNRSHYRGVSRNCADFVKDVINFYYPKALHRGVVADVGITTPKQLARTLVRYSGHHPELQLSKLVIPQIPGSLPRSTAVHGVVESFFKSKKYIVPSAVVSPIFAGCVFAVYVGTGAGRFDPAHNALVFAPGGEPELPVGLEDRRAYQEELKGLLANTDAEGSSGHIRKQWARLQARAQMEFDAKGRPVLQMRVGERLVNVGVSADNILSSSSAPWQLVQELLEARLEAELSRKAAPTISEKELVRDWQLLQEARNVEGKELADGFTPRPLKIPASARPDKASSNLP